MNRFDKVLLAAAEYGQSFLDGDDIIDIVDKGRRFDHLFNELNRNDRDYVEAHLDLFDTIKNLIRGAVR